MTLDSIDQALNVVLAGLIYGSSAWLACAFSFFVLSQRRKRKVARPMLLLAPAAEETAVETFTAVCSEDVGTKEALWVEDEEPCIEITIAQPLLIAPIAQKGLPVEQLVSGLEESLIEENLVEEGLVETGLVETGLVEENLAEAVNECVVEAFLGTPSPSSVEIVCEPVNWRKWKVADLRKASIAKICGVRTRPIGSRRNLLKADLIAQYEQQLKRLTKAPSKRLVITELSAVKEDVA